MLILEFLPALAEKLPSAVAIKHRGDALTYGELHRRVVKLAAAFGRLGLTAGDRIVLLGHPSIALCIAEYAAVAARAIPVAAFPSLAPAELQGIVDDAQPAAIVFNEDNRAVAEQLTYARRPIEISSDGRPGAYVTTDELMQQRLPPPASKPLDPDAVALLIYTGGTTGRPKGVAHTYRSISRWMGLSGPSPGNHPTRNAILFNLAHASGQSGLWASVFAGGCLTLVDNYPARPEEVVDLIERERVTMLAAVSGLVRTILALPDVQHRDFRSVRSLVVGGAPISGETLLQASSVFRAAWIGHAYSLTETGQVVSILPASHFIKTNRLERLRSVGAPALTRLFGQEPFSARIVDEEGRIMPQGKAGELVVRGVQMMRGYWNDPGATQEAIRNGWFHTGDIGCMDEEGYLYLVDRKKDMIIAANGVCVYSVEVEHVVVRHPSVHEAAAIAVRTDGESEEVAVVVSLRHGHTLSLEELRRFCANRMAGFKIPAHLILVAALPRTPVGKIDKTALRRLCRGGSAPHEAPIASSPARAPAVFVTCTGDTSP